MECDKNRSENDKGRVLEQRSSELVFMFAEGLTFVAEGETRRRVLLHMQDDFWTRHASRSRPHSLVIFRKNGGIKNPN